MMLTYAKEADSLPIRHQCHQGGLPRIQDLFVGGCGVWIALGKRAVVESQIALVETADDFSRLLVVEQ